MGTARSGHPGGLTPSEAAVMDLWDQDMGTHAIAAELDIPIRKVKNIVSMYCDGDTGPNTRAMIAGSQALLAALQEAAA